MKPLEPAVGRLPNNLNDLLLLEGWKPSKDLDTAQLRLGTVVLKDLILDDIMKHIIYCIYTHVYIYIFKKTF